MINVIKGWLGEKVATLTMWAMLDKNVYRRVDNVIVNTPNGTTQIDHVLVSVYGIFVIETKNIKGWIFGEANTDRWTQVIYGKKRQFQNPLKQNYRHTKCLSEYLKLDHDLFKSIIFFIGNCEFKTDMPSNVLDGGLIPYIKHFRQAHLSLQKVVRIEASLSSLKKDKSLNRRNHLASLRARHESTTICPRCGGLLVQRVSKKGKFADKLFLGCSNYPKCKYIKKV
jgi:restriction system protein